MYELEVKIDLPHRAALICAEALQLEAQSKSLPRSKVGLSCAGDKLIFRASAQDLSAMRAAVNTYLRWIDMCIQLTEKKTKTK